MPAFLFSDLQPMPCAVGPAYHDRMVLLRWSKLPLRALALGAMFFVASNAASAERVVTLLHTNDFHGRLTGFNAAPGNATAQTDDPGRPPQEFDRTGMVGGFAALATAVKRQREGRGDDNVLLVHAGDTFSDDLLGNLTRGEAIVRAMNALRFDFMALGNHDFDYGAERTRALARLAKFPMRGANVIERMSGRPFLGEPTFIARRGDLRIGFIALGYHNSALTGDKKNTQQLRFDNGIEHARRLVGHLRPKVDAIVVVSHQGTKVDRKLAETVDGIDVIVGGHSHDDLAPVRVGNTYLVQAMSDAAELGVLNLHFDGRRLQRVEGDNLTLWHDEFPPDTEMQALIDRERAPYKAQLEAEIARAEDVIGRRYKSESPFDVLAADILRTHAAAEVALLPGVGYGVSLTAGPITREALYRLLPHPSKLVVLSLTGAELKAVLEQSATNQKTADPLQGVGGLIQNAGLSYTVDLQREPGTRISDVAVNGAPLDPAKRYRVATHNGMRQGLHNYRVLTQARVLKESPETVTDIVERAFKQRGRIAAPALGAVHLIKESG